MFNWKYVWIPIQNWKSQPYQNNYIGQLQPIRCQQQNEPMKRQGWTCTDTSMQTKLWLGLFLNCWSWCSSSDLIKTLYLKEIFAFVIDLLILPENNYKHLQYLFKNLHTLLYKFFFYFWRGSSLGNHVWTIFNRT